MAEIRKDIEELRAYYGQLYWYQRWFFPSKLAAVLDDPDSKPSRICSVFKENVSFWSYPFLWGIWRFSNSNTFSIYKRLREASLDDYWIEFLDYFESKDALEKQQKLDGFSSRHASSVIEILKFMNQEQPLSSQEADAFFEAIVVHPQPDMILTVLKSLKGTKLLCGPFREQNFYNLIAHGTLASRQGGLNDTFEALSKTRLLCNDHKQTNFNAVLKRALTHGGDLDCALTRVPNSLALFQGDDAQKLFQLIAGHKEPERVTLLLTGITDLGIMINDELLNFCQDQLNSFGVKEIIITLNILYDQGLIQGDENQKMNVVWSVLKHEHAYPLDSILSLLQENRLLDQYNFVTAINDQFFKSYSDLLPFLQKISPHIPEQNQTNFNLLTASIERNKPRYHYMAIKSICSALEKHNLFSQQNFEQVLAHETPEILSEAIIFFCRINNGSNLLTGENAQLTLDLLFRHSTSLEYLTRNITPRHLREHWHPYITTILQRADLTPRELAQTLESYVRIHILQLQIGQAPAIHHPIQHNNEQALINGNQSTHTASVHAATDLTAWLLLETHKKDGGGFINLAGLWPVIEHNFLQRKAKIEQEMQKLEFSPTTLTETQVQQRTHNRTILDDIRKTETQMSAAEDCLKRLRNVSCDIILSAEKKKTALSYIHESDLKEDEIIQALLPGLIEQRLQESKLSLQQFIFWLYEEIATTPSKPDYILRFIQALYEIQRGYNMDYSGNDDLTEEDHSICYGGTANKFPELLTGLSSLIQFVFINEGSIGLSIKQQLINQVLPYCESLLQQTHQGDLATKTSFCTLIDQLMSSNEVSMIYETLFSEPNFIAQIKAEFRLYTLLCGERGLEQQFTLFKEHSFPYIPAINPKEEANAFYSSDFLKVFNHYLEAKNQFEQERHQSKSTATILADIGLMKNPGEDGSNDKNCETNSDEKHIGDSTQTPR